MSAAEAMAYGLIDKVVETENVRWILALISD
jgi:ATP-dependent protease ClpP protease subunit